MMTNKEFLKTKIEPKTSCARCNKAHCCKWTTNIDISLREWNKLVPYIDNYVIAKMRLAVLNKEKHDMYDCAFLDENNKCIAYKDRPLTCQLHYVNTAKKYCNSKKYPNRIIKMVDKVELFLMLPKKHIETESKSMIEMYKKYIKEN